MTAPSCRRSSATTPSPPRSSRRQGADALRWYFMSTNIVRGGDTRISDQGIDDVVRQVITPIWNAYSFFTLYANADGSRRLTAPTPRTARPLHPGQDAPTRRSRHGPHGCVRPARRHHEIQLFIDALNNWYIRRSRDRFWAPAAEADPQDKQTPTTPCTRCSRS